MKPQVGDIVIYTRPGLPGEGTRVFTEIRLVTSDEKLKLDGILEYECIILYCVEYLTPLRNLRYNTENPHWYQIIRPHT